MTTSSVISDGNNIARIYNGANKLSFNGQPTQAIIGCIKQAREQKIRAPGARNTWLWDGRAQWRYDIHPGYKATRNLPDPRRDADRASFQAQFNHIKRSLSLLGIGQMTASAHEADDLAGIMVGAAKQKDPLAEIELVSGDGDWVQLVRDGVVVRHPTEPSKFYTLSNLMNQTGYRTPYGYLEGKCLHGDSSDDVPGVGGIGEKGAPEFIAEFGGVRQFWNAVDSGAFVPRLKKHKNLASPEGRAAFGRNLRLMQLIRPHKPAPGETTYDPGKFDREAFREFCQEFSFLSITRGFDEFVAPFEK